MKKVYLDYNIWDEMFKNPDTLSFFKSKSDYSYYMSVAHLEELLHAENNETEQYKGCAQALKLLMISMSVSGLITYRTSIDFVSDPSIHSVSTQNINVEHNTQDLIAAISQNEFNEMIEETDNESMKIEGVKQEDVFMKIWEQPQIAELINEKNRKAECLRKLIRNGTINLNNAIIYMRPEWVNEYGKDDDAKFLAFRSLLSQSKHIEKGCFSNIRGDCVCLETIIEILNNFLLSVGYKQDRSLRTHISGKYDLQHFILSTYCDVFITKDKRFRERVRAIAYYLGIPIDVKLWKNGQLL